MDTNEKLCLLRELMQNDGIIAYIITSSDFHSSEYVGNYFRTREFMSGFTGSAGTLVVLEKSAFLWTDGRYFLQAEAQLKNSEIVLMKSGMDTTPSIPEFLAESLNDGDTIGFDGRTVSNSFVLKLEKGLAGKRITISYQNDLVDKIWYNRPEISKKPVWPLDLKYCGVSAYDKLCAVRRQMTTDYLIVTALDEIAWMLNLRGSDIECTPVFLSYLIIAKDNATLFISNEKVNEETAEYLSKLNIKTTGYGDFYHILSTLKGSVQVDSASANYCVLRSLNTVEIIDKQSPIELLKAIKNKTEAKNIKKAHIKDGVAVTRFIYWLKHGVKDGNISELDAVNKINELRREQDDFIDISFNSIIAYREHGAIVHYEPKNDTNISLKPYGLCLTDTGGHYLDGTTDITRTIALGELTDKEKHYYTLVLKGNLNLANAVFKHGCTGENLDQLACSPLWREGLAFNHSTGHGVGYLLSVHEGPQRIYWDTNKNNHTVLEKGMIISNEPGIYIENEFGIRLENLLMVNDYMQSEYGEFLCFDTLTLAPFDLSAIDKSMLNSDEVRWLNAYHKKVYNEISPYLNDEERKWLRQETREI